MSVRFTVVLGVLVFGAVACESQPTDPVDEGPMGSLRLAVDFASETHFRCYIVSEQTPDAPKTVILRDQFLGPDTLRVDEPLGFCVPTSKDRLPIEAPEEHLTMYVARGVLTPHLLVPTEDQFGPRTLEVVGARALLVPTEKLIVDEGFPDELNHYWCYEANGPEVLQAVTLDDQFHQGRVRVFEPKLLCNPVRKFFEGQASRIEEADVHLTCYAIKGRQPTVPTTVEIDNQLEHDFFTVTTYLLLCVPSEKGEPRPVPS